MATPVRVVSVEIVEEELEVFDAEVDQDNSFIAGGVVLHNTDICRSRAGQIYRLQDYEAGAAPIPPAHIQCRSSIAGIPKGYNKERLSGNLSFEKWLERVPEHIGEWALGEAAYQMWKEGKLPAKGFFDPTGKKYTIDQLREIEAEQLKGMAPAEVLDSEPLTLPDGTVALFDSSGVCLQPWWLRGRTAAEIKQMTPQQLKRPREVR
jgi:hypothetical protein